MMEEKPEEQCDDEEPDDPEMIKLTELLKEMDVKETKPTAALGGEEEDPEIDQFVRELSAMNVKQKSK